MRLVAFDARDGEVVGAAYVNPHSGYISAVGVASAHRGRGVGKLLVVASVEQIELHARAQPQRAPRSPGSRARVQPPSSTTTICAARCTCHTCTRRSAS